jgi:hypothetical protein
MVLDLLQSWSLAWIVTEHSQDKVLELITQVLAINLLPVGLVISSAEQVVEVLSGSSFLEWENTLHQNEEDHSSGKDINLSSIVLLSLFDLWSHVGHCSSV